MKNVAVMTAMIIIIVVVVVVIILRAKLANLLLTEVGRACAPVLLFAATICYTLQLRLN